mmetsp:Transcript_1248/g.1816  ORF Transcript_1248/g.1816 Transcript_1248/m.1816 type:complete len:499 (+) Transcript_1248:242-1738(+)
MQYETAKSARLIEESSFKIDFDLIPLEIQRIVFAFVGEIDSESPEVALQWRAVSRHSFVKLCLSQGDLVEKRCALLSRAIRSCNSFVVSPNGIVGPGIGLSVLCSAFRDGFSQMSVLNMNNVKLQEADLINLIFSFSSLEELYLSNCNIPSTSASTIGQFLSTDEKLKKLDLSKNKFLCAGLTKILNALDKNQSLSWLDLSDNSDASETDMESCAVALGEVLKVNKSLSYLDFSENDIGNAGAEAIASGLLENTTLRTINVFGQYVLHTGIVALGEMLKSNSSLQVLDVGTIHAYLDTNPFPDSQPGVALGQALKQNSTLKQLNLTNFCFGTEDTINLCEGLKVNSGLETLNLYENLIGSKGVMALADALSHNTSLRNLNIDCSNFESGASGLVYPEMSADATNEFVVAGYNELSLSLKTNDTLNRLWIGADRIDHSDATKIASSFANNIKYNTGLKELHLNFEGLSQADGCNIFQETARYNHTCKVFINEKMLNISS